MSFKSVLGSLLASLALGACWIIFATPFNSTMLAPIAVAVVTIAFAGSRFWYTSQYDDKLCNIIGYTYPVAMIAGSALRILAAFGNIWSKAYKPIIWSGFIIALIGVLGCIVWTIIVRVEFGGASKRSSSQRRSGGGASSVSGGSAKGAVAKESDRKRELGYVANNYTTIKNLGFGFSAHYEVSYGIYGGNIEFGVRVTIGQGSAKDGYEMNKVKANLRSETDSVCENILSSAKNKLSYMNLPRSYNISVKVK